MSLPLEEYALIGDTQTAALVGRDGSIDWLCLPRFDSGACFAALLGTPDNGRWLLAPADPHRSINRRYQGESLILENEFATDAGRVRVIDCMPIRGELASPSVMRRVEGLTGRVRMRSEVLPRFDYGQILPWMRTDGRRIQAVAGPDAVVLDGDVPHGMDDQRRAVADFWLAAGENVEFRLAWTLSRQEPPAHLSVGDAIEQTRAWWDEWSGRARCGDGYREAVVRSLITLKALAYGPSGGIVAAPTTSLPERLGGVRNWDYRYCWIRDATFTLLALLEAGYDGEAVAWREWMLRAVAGQPKQMQIVYGIEGERRLTEMEMDWLPGYEGSSPARLGNDASRQFQLDVYGELMDAMHQARCEGIAPQEDAWMVQRQLLDFLEGHWREPDNGIWEVRGPRRHFTQSKVMAWAAADRAVRAVEEFGLDGPADRWRRLRQDIFDEVCERGYDAERNTFVQYYGSSDLDASLLLMPQVGFLPATDERVLGTIAAIERELCSDGFVFRYAERGEVDGLPGGEGVFLACSFWLADDYLLAGRTEDGRELFERLLGLRNDVGLLSEEYDPRRRRLVGNFPQALSHISLVNTSSDLVTAAGPARRRARQR